MFTVPTWSTVPLLLIALYALGGVTFLLLVRRKRDEWHSAEERMLNALIKSLESTVKDFHQKLADDTARLLQRHLLYDLG